MSDELHEWAQSLDTLLAQVWKRLGRGVADRRAPGRHPTLATISPDGMPQARTVVLRSADPDAGVATIFTDRFADKVDDVRAHPHAALHIWDNLAHLQIRLLTHVAVKTGAELEPIWANLSDHARRCYGFSPASGEAIAEGLSYSKTPDISAFAVLELTIERMDILHLGYQHRRAEFSRHNDWAGQWTVP